MPPYYADDRVTVWAGDCLDVLPTLPDESVDCVVTDPPAGISFMGRDWDHHKGGRVQWAAWLTGVMREAWRVAKPGAHALVWALPRTSHWTAIGIEDAGWEIRDRVTHLFGTGFPKSRDVSKAIDAEAGATREVVGRRDSAVGGSMRTGEVGSTFADDAYAWQRDIDITAPATPEAAQWQGWGTALKPAAEDWWLARKPLVGTVAANVLRYGTGALNIDACRIAATDGFEKAWDKPVSSNVGGPEATMFQKGIQREVDLSANKPVGGRWPANVVLDESQAAALDQMSGETRSTKLRNTSTVYETEQTVYGVRGYSRAIPGVNTYDDDGGASRYFYTAKAGSEERITHNGVAHPTVKPLSLMRWLVRLVTPPGGLILDPFAGSGTTVEAAILEGFRCIAVECGGPPGTDEHEYLPMITQRINRRRDPIAYITAAGEDLGLFGLDDDEPEAPAQPQGRWPANVVLDRSQAEALDQMSGESVSLGGSRGAGGQHGAYSPISAQPDVAPGYGDTGGASRFFKVVDDDDDEDGVGLDHPP